MILRLLKDSDIPILQEAHAKSGINCLFPDMKHPHMLGSVVLVDENDIPVVGLSSKLMIEGYLFFVREMDPECKFAALKQLEREYPAILRGLGFNEFNVSIPPQLEKSFGRKLCKAFGFGRNWPSFFRKF